MARDEEPRSRAESTMRPRTYTDPLDVQLSKAGLLGETHIPSAAVPHSTSAFHTQFPVEEEAPHEGEEREQEEEEEEEPDEGAEDEEDTRSMIRGLIIDAQRRTEPTARPAEPTVCHEEIEEEAVDDDLHTPQSIAADEQAAEAVESTLVTVSAPSSPSESAAEVTGRKRPGRLVPPRENSASSLHHLSPSSFTIASSAPASPFPGSQQSDDEWSL